MALVVGRHEAAVLRHLGFVEWQAGNWDDAARYAAESLELLSQLGRLSPPNETTAAIIAAHRGQITDARVRATSGFHRAEADVLLVAQANHGWVLGYIELSLGDPSAALEHLRRAYELKNLMSMREPGSRWELGDLIEALIAVGELDEAHEVLTTWGVTRGCR